MGTSMAVNSAAMAAVTANAIEAKRKDCLHDKNDRRIDEGPNVQGKSPSVH